MRSKRKKNQRELEGNKLIDGLEISGNFYDKNENRILTLLMKGMIVYLVSAGMIGGAITAAGTAFNQVVFNVVVFLLSMAISLIYYNKTTENVGDILYLFMIIFFGLFYGSYINSGFYAWMNDIIGAAGAYFDLPDIGGYVQQIKDTGLTVTFASCYLGAVVVILVNMSIVKRMMFGDLILNAMIVLFLPSYLELEPNYFYNVLLISGVVIAVIWKVTGRYEKIDNNSVYIRYKKEITYTYCFKGHMYAFAQMTVAVLALLFAIYIIVPKDTYTLLRGRSEAKQQTDDIVETLITSGISGFFNRYDNIGGMNSGRLGGINSVRLDYETDLIITYAPFSLNPIYFRTFVGGEYHPYHNMWSVANPILVNRQEYERLEKEYEDNNRYSARGVMDIENIDGENGEYALYYSDKSGLINRGFKDSKVYYPYFEKIGDYYSSGETMTPDERRYWLAVPNDNVPSLINTIGQLGITEDMDELEIADRIRQYYYENIPYTLRPGSTPIRRDFVNYFLDSNRKGYCVHFASAAVLIFRYLDIPARYVEGYAIDYNDISNAKKEADLNPADYYDGYSELKDAPVVTIEITDASAHAWVEIYTEERGWIPVELTPPSSDTDFNDRSTLWERLLNLFNSSSQSQDQSNNDDKSNNIDTAKIRRNLIIIFILFCIYAVSFTLYRIVSSVIRYRNADINTRLIMRYHRFLHSASNRYDLSLTYNYCDQINAIQKDKEQAEKLISILERAGFSDSMISEEEFAYCMEQFKRLRRGSKN